jgi:hypothetical protein
MRRLEDEDLTPEDAAFVDGAIQACLGLQNDARALAKYADRQTPLEQRAFEKAHQQSEQAIRDLLTENSARPSPGGEPRDRNE